MTAMAQERASWFQRFVLPGFAFKAVVIGGGYATGRELAEFFLPAGPWGGILAILLAMLVWSGVCVLTFMFARAMHAFDYRAFFRALLGPFWVTFEIAYLLFIVLILAVFGAAADEIGRTTFGLPQIAGSIVLVGAIAAVTAYGNAAVECLFKWVTFFLYGVYAVFAVLALSAFGAPALQNVAHFQASSDWWIGGLTYGGYNVVGAVVILPMLRHLTSTKDAVIAGALAGPLAIWPALLFFFCMLAVYPGIEAQTLPSDFLLAQLNMPVFRIAFQIMIFAALLESGAGAVHGFIERISGVYEGRRGAPLPKSWRLLIAAILLVSAVFIAGQIGLVALIASGYRALALTILIVFIAPLLTIGVWRLRARPAAPAPQQI